MCVCVCVCVCVYIYIYIDILFPRKALKPGPLKYRHSDS